MVTGKEKKCRDVIDALKRTSKGQLVYDTKWREEGRTEEIVNLVKQSISPSIHVSPKSVIKSLNEKQQISSHDPGSPPTLNQTPSKPFYRDTSFPTSSSSDAFEKLRLYELQRSEKVQKENEKYIQRIKEKNEALNQRIKREMELIHKQALVESIEMQNKYEEECAQLMKSLELQLNLNENGAQSGTTSNGDLSSTLKEFQKKNKLIKKKEEIKRIEQTQFKQSLINDQEAIILIIQECEQRAQQSPLPPNITDELNYFMTILHGMLKDVDLLLLTRREFTTDDVHSAANRHQESLELREKFFDLIQQHIVQSVAVSLPFTSTQPVSTTIVYTTSEPNGQSEVTAKVEQPDKDMDEFTQDSESIYAQFQADLAAIEEKCKIFSDNKANRKLREALQLNVRTPINQLFHHQSLHALKSKVKNMLDLFNGKPNGNQNVYCSEENNSFYFVLNDAAKQFLNGSFNQINMALKLAPVIVYLWTKVPLFGKIFLAQLFRNCPYAIPYYPVKSANESALQYKIRCGYRPNSEGQIIEADQVYRRRMYAMIQLYAAITQCNMNQGHPRDLHYAWNWLARVLNDTPRIRITALMLDAFLSVSTHKLLRLYGKQFQKLLHYIARIYIPKIIAITPPFERQTFMKFKSMLENVQQTIAHSRDASRELAQALDRVPDEFFTS